MRSRAFIPGFLILVALLLAGSHAALADDERDRVSFGHRIVVHEGETVGDVVCFLCSVESHGTVEGDVVTFLGSVRSSAPIEGSVVSFAGNVLLDSGAGVGGDLVVFGGDLRKNGPGHLDGDQVIVPAVVLLIPLIIVIGIILGISSLLRRRVPIYYMPPAR